MKKVMNIEGMSCSHCENRVTNTLMDLEGVESVVVNLSEKTATVEADERVNDDLLKETVEDLGFEVLDIK